MSNLPLDGDKPFGGMVMVGNDKIVQLINYLIVLATDYSNRPFIQDACPLLTPAEREFIISGVWPELWNKLFSEGE